MYIYIYTHPTWNRREAANKCQVDTHPHPATRSSSRFAFGLKTYVYIYITISKSHYIWVLNRPFIEVYTKYVHGVPHIPKNTNKSASQQIPEITVYTTYTIYIYTIYIYIFVSLSLSLIGLDVLTSQPVNPHSVCPLGSPNSGLKPSDSPPGFPEGTSSHSWRNCDSTDLPSCAPAVRGIQSLILPFGKGSEPLSVYTILYIYILYVCVSTKSMFYHIWGLPHVIFEQCSKNTISSLFMSWLIEVPIGDRTIK